MVAMQFPIFFTCRSALIFYILKHIFLLIIWSNGNSSGRVSKVKILRSIDGQVDRIRFPGQLCRTTSAQDIGCDVMQKRKGQSCSCTCNVKDPAGASLVKNTVVYNNGSWQCLGSSQVRQLAGCNLLSIDEGITDPIPDISRKPIYVSKTPDQRCRVNVLNSTYLRCNGTWKLLKERVLRRFVNTSRRFTTDQVVIKYTGATKSHPTVNGRVIRLAVSCRKRKQNHNVGCIVMKVKGKLRCPLVASSKPTGTEVNGTATTASRIVKSSPLLTSPTRKNGTKVSNVTTAARNAMRKAESPKLEHLHRPKEGASKKSIKKRGGFADETVVYSLAVIVGAFALVILVIVFVSAFVVTVMKKKLNSSNEQNASNHAGCDDDDDDDDDEDDDLKFTF